MAYTQVSVWLEPGSQVRVNDSPNSAPGVVRRTVVIGWDGFSLHVGRDTDEETAACASLLIAAAQQVRDAARARIAEREPDTSGSEMPYSDGPDDSAHRAEMRDAGRGAMLR